MRKWMPVALILAAFAAGMAWGGPDDEEAAEPDLLDLEKRLDQVRREVKIISFDTGMQRVPALITREKQYTRLLGEIEDLATRDPAKLKPLLEQGRELKLAALKDLNEILKLHRGQHLGLTEEEVWTRLANARFEGVSYNEEWLVNILDDIEEKVGINIEVDARVYKFDTVTFDFDKTSARAMLQIMGDNLLFTWLVRGDAEEGRDYDREKLTWLWDVTTQADKTIIERNQQGVNSRYYVPGPLSDWEDYTWKFLAWYTDLMKTADE